MPINNPPGQEINKPIESPNKKVATKHRSTKEEKLLLKKANKCYEQAKKFRSKFDKHWKKYSDYYDGKQWNPDRPTYRASPVANIVRSTIQTIIPILTDLEPGFNVAAQEPSDFRFARLLGRVVETIWTRMGYNIEVVEWITDSQMLDYGVAKIVWDPEFDHNRGEVIFSIRDPKRIYYPESATDFNKNCPWVIEEFYKPLGEVKRMFPDKADLIETTSKDKDDQSVEKQAAHEVVVVTPIDEKSRLSEIPELGKMDDNEQVRLWEMWLDDYSLKEFELETGKKVTKKDKNGKETEVPETRKEKRRLFPKGRLVTIAPDLKLILADRENPREDGEKPYVKLVDTVRPREFRGDGQIGPIVEAQDIINKALSGIIDHINSMSNAVWILDHESGIDEDDITNQVGLILVKSQGTEVRREAPPSLPSDYRNLYELGLQLSELVSGINDVSQGRRPTGVTAAAAIEVLEEAAQTRLRLKERNLNVALTRLGYLMINTILQHYTEPRIIKITGVDGEEYQSIMFEQKPEGGFIATTRTFRQPKRQDGTINTDSDFVESPIQQINSKRGIFDIEVVSGTSLPFSKQRREQKALLLHERGVFDEEDLLDAMDISNKEEILRKLEERKQQEAVAAEQQQVPPA